LNNEQDDIELLKSVTKGDVYHLSVGQLPEALDSREELSTFEG